MNIAEKVKAKYICHFDAQELAVRLAETYNRIKRPPGATAEQAFSLMPDDMKEAWAAAANTALRYIQEQIDGLKRTN